MKIVTVRRARWPYKFRAEFPEGRAVSFGRRGYSDYTIHRDRVRMLRYLDRHARRENWRFSGRYTAGFWSRWLLWSKPSLRAAARETERALGHKYKIKISRN
jgi:hypothetical protein